MDIHANTKGDSHMSQATGLGTGFNSETATVNGTTLHYVRGGEGPAVILIHGFPQDWFEFHTIMPRLAERFTVIAVDLRGMGGSTPTDDGYDAATMAQDVYELVSALELERVYLVGHDLGGQVTYAFVRQYPQVTRGAMILDSPIPGIEGLDDLLGDPRIWHGDFHMIPDLPEALVGGRQEIYFRYFFDIGTRDGTGISEADLRHYANAYASPAQLHAAFEMYRAFPANLEFNEAHQEPNDVPLYLAAGEGSPFAKLIPKMAVDLRTKGFAHVESGLIPSAVHYLVEDQPEAVADLIERYAAPQSA
jgi:pimeloyl-ACP methyl ester carboxylesterase